MYGESVNAQKDGDGVCKQRVLINKFEMQEEAKALKEEISSAEGPVADAVLDSIDDDEYKLLMQTMKDRTLGRLACVRVIVGTSMLFSVSKPASTLSLLKPEQRQVKTEVKKEPEVEAEVLAAPVAELPPPEELAGNLGGEETPTSKQTQLEEPVEDTLVNTPSPAKDVYFGANSPEPLPEDETPKTQTSGKPPSSEAPSSVASRSSDASTGFPSKVPEPARSKPTKATQDQHDLDEPPKSMPFDFAPPTQAAINARLRRIFKARANGEYQVDADFIKMYKDKSGGGQAKIYKLFERTGFNPVLSLKVRSSTSFHKFV